MKPKVTVYSDYICPFCFIGKDRIDRLEKEFDVEVEWKPFELHPETPKEGSSLDEMGFNNAYIEMILENVTKLAKDAGLQINFPDKISNSRLALEISEYAKDKGKFDEFYQLVFKGYWQENKNIGDKEFLFDAAGKAGLDVDGVKEYVDSEEGYARLKKSLIEGRSMGITGVPTFIIGDKMVVGAQPYEVLKKVVEDEFGLS